MSNKQWRVNLHKWDVRGLGDQIVQANGQSISTDLAAGLQFTYPNIQQVNNWYVQGFVPKNDFAFDLRDWYGIEFDFTLNDETRESLCLKVTIGLLDTMTSKGLQQERVNEVETEAWLSGLSGRVSIPFKQFDHYRVLTRDWKFVRSIRLSAHAETGSQVTCVISNLQFRRRPHVYLSTPIRSKSAEAGQYVNYDISVLNCSDTKQDIRLYSEQYGWEIMPVDIKDRLVSLQPGELRVVQVKVKVLERIAPGGHEKQTIVAAVNVNSQGNQDDVLQLTTVRALPHPYVLKTEDEWQAVMQKIEEHDWAKSLLKTYVDRATNWQVPEINDNGLFLFETVHSHHAQCAAIAWKLTQEKVFAEKVALFLKRLSDPDKGYMHTLQACHQELVHEGEFFKHTAIAYDIIYDTDLLSTAERERIEVVFRQFIDLIDWDLGSGKISNWNLAQLAGAAYCSQVLQDLERMDRFIFGVGGFVDQLSKGTFDDGWWYECAVGYNLMCAGLFSEIAQSCRPWGLNLVHMQVPASYNTQVGPGQANETNEAIWGPNKRNYRSIDQLWDSLIPMADYRGVVFGINDSAEAKLQGIASNGSLDPRYDLAYYHYRKPEYADMLQMMDWSERDLLFAVPNMQGSDSEHKPYTQSAYAHNAGVVVLRSQKAGREPREQIQAVVKYGSHGGGHGHFDRMSLLGLSRYGRSFYNPQNIWYFYHYFMFKFFVQSSINHNMVIVDLKQQEPTEAALQHFHTGSLFQACAVDHVTRWSYPPYGGRPVHGHQSLTEQSWHEGRYVPIPDHPPAYGEQTGYTEPILQRRLTIVTDDYVILFDHMSGEEVHTYDCLFHVKGLKEIKAKAKSHRKHTAKLSDDPLSGAQFITDCDWYEVQTPACTSFEMLYGPEYASEVFRSNYNEAGPLKLDIHTLWPPEVELITGTDPEYYKVEKKLWYTVSGDDTELAAGQFGAWVLGKDTIDVSVAGVDALQLKVSIDGVYEEHFRFKKKTEKTVFWGDPHIVTASGEIIYLSDLPLTYHNTDKGHGIGKDYFGGPVKIEAQTYEQAIPANPEDMAEEGVISVSLSGLDAVRFKTSIGGDYPLGDETYTRKMLSARTRGKEACFVTIMEPFEQQSAIEKAEAIDAEHVIVYLKDGRKQVVSVSGLHGQGEPIAVKMQEYDEAGVLIREDVTVNNKG